MASPAGMVEKGKLKAEKACRQALPFIRNGARVQWCQGAMVRFSSGFANEGPLEVNRR
jgi:hypothetical protein